MKISEETIDVTKSDSLDEETFYIKATPEAFESISGRLYNNRILAPIRELSANAYDAHVDVDKQNCPFEIQLPNVIDGNFRIRDFGPGISPEKINSVYRGYFNSTKQNSNKFVGCLGLGSKSPFAYTQSFNVKSYYNGICYNYTCYKNEKNYPSIAPMGQTETSEPNGLEVYFPVKSSDFRSFAEEVKGAFSFYQVKPMVIGFQDDFKFKEYKYVLSNSDFGITDGRQNSFVVMGNIAYPFKVDDFYNTDYSFDIKETKIIKWGIHLFVPIGSVGISSSREALSYNPETLKIIKKYMSNAVAALEDELANKVKTIDNVWDARIYCNAANRNVLVKVIQNDYDSFTINWNNKIISDIVEIDKISGAPSIAQSLKKEPARKNYDALSLRKSNVTSFYVKRDMTLFVNDMNIGGYAAASRYMDAENISSAYMISNDYNDDFIKEIGIPLNQIVFVSSIEKAERKPRIVDGQRVLRTTLQKYHNGSFENVEVDLNNESGFYFEVKRGEVKIGDDFIDSDQVNKLFRNLITLEFVGNIYAVRPCDLEKIKNKSNWKPAIDKINSFMKSITAIKKEVDYIKSVDALSDTYKTKLNKYSYLFKSVKIENCDLFNSVVQFSKMYDVTKSVSKNIAFQSLNKIVSSVTLDVDNSKIIESIQKLEKKYPILKYVNIDYGFNEEKTTDIENYINGIISLEDAVNIPVVEDAA